MTLGGGAREEDFGLQSSRPHLMFLAEQNCANLWRQWIWTWFEQGVEALWAAQLTEVFVLVLRIPIPMLR